MPSTSQTTPLQTVALETSLSRSGVRRVRLRDRQRTLQIRRIAETLHEFEFALKPQLFTAQQRESFRKELGNTQFVDMLLKQQFNHWRFFQAMRSNQAIEEAKDAIVAKNAAAAAAADATEAAE